LNAKVDKKTLEDIYHNNRKILNEVEVAIYDTRFDLLYHDAVDIDFVKETPAMLQDILKNKEIRFYQEKWQVIGITFPYKDKTYIITAAAYDQYGYNKLNSLLSTIFLVFILSIFLIYAAGIFFSKKVAEIKTSFPNWPVHSMRCSTASRTPLMPKSILSPISRMS